MTQLTYQQVWNTLSSVNVNDWKKQKGQLDYLGWSAAWHILMQQFPYETYDFHDETNRENGTVMTHCTVKIGDLERTMWLAVMNYNNKSIANPTYQEIQNTRMRCLVKCIAMYGLGFYIYDGQKLPYEDEDLPDEQKDQEERSVVEKPFVFVRVGNRPVESAQIHDAIATAMQELSGSPDNDVIKNCYERNLDNLKILAAAAKKVTDAKLKKEYLKQLNDLAAKFNPPPADVDEVAKEME